LLGAPNEADRLDAVSGVPNLLDPSVVVIPGAIDELVDDLIRDLVTERPLRGPMRNGTHKRNARDQVRQEPNWGLAGNLRKLYLEDNGSRDVETY
jgi:hypothetical protein